MDNLSSIGVKVKVKLGCTEILGRLYAYLSDEDMLMLVSEEAGQRKYTIVRTSKASLVILGEDLEQPLDLAIPAVPPEQIKQLDRQNVGAQIYAELGKTYTVGWRGAEICLPDLELTISPPYKSASDINGDSRSLARMTGVLQKVRTKLGLD